MASLCCLREKVSKDSTRRMRRVTEDPGEENIDAWAVSRPGAATELFVAPWTFVILILFSEPQRWLRSAVSRWARLSMQDVGSTGPSTRRRKHSFTWHILVIVLGIALVPALMSISPDELVRRWCPVNSFYTRGFDLGSSFMPAVFLAGCFPFLVVLVWSRVNLSASSGALSPPWTRWRYFIPVVCALGCGSALSVHLYIRSVSYYYCLTPDEIVVWNGYHDGPHNYGWDSVREVHGWCWTNTSERAGRRFSEAASTCCWTAAPRCPSTCWAIAERLTHIMKW
jgi:hypothetical protein